MSYAETLRRLDQHYAAEQARQRAAEAAALAREADQIRRAALYVEDQLRRHALRVAAGELSDE